MKTKNSILLGTLGKYSGRFHTYQPEKSFSDRLEIAKSIPKTDGIETAESIIYLKRLTSELIQTQ